MQVSFGSQISTGILTASRTMRMIGYSLRINLDAQDMCTDRPYTLYERLISCRHSIRARLGRTAS